MTRNAASSTKPQTRSRLRFPTRFAVALAVFAACGCGGRNGGVQLVEPDAPDPGTMATVSITPLEVPEPQNLIQNGEFSDWHEGASAPDFFMAPAANPGHSTLELARGQAGEGGAVRQTWQSNDALDAYTNVYRTWVTDLWPNTKYRVNVVVHNQSPNTLLLRAFQYNARSPAEAELMTEKPAILGGVAIDVSDGFQGTGFTFTTGAEPEFCVLIAVKNNSPQGAFPAVCVWDAWRLYEVPAEAPKQS